jgi:hypothetical protein
MATARRATGYNDDGDDNGGGRRCHLNSHNKNTGDFLDKSPV